MLPQALSGNHSLNDPLNGLETVLSPQYPAENMFMDRWESSPWWMAPFPAVKWGHTGICTGGHEPKARQEPSSWGSH